MNLDNLEKAKLRLQEMGFRKNLTRNDLIALLNHCNQVGRITGTDGCSVLVAVIENWKASEGNK